jgi:hypothetical protein
MSDLPPITRLERSLFTAEGDKYDHRADPRDVTGLMEADLELQKNMLELGYVVRWAIDGRWRLTDRGYREMERRRSIARTERVKGEVRPFEDDRKHFHAIEANRQEETEEEKLKRTISKEHDNGTD